jgi:hypothetical protein
MPDLNPAVLTLAKSSFVIGGVFSANGERLTANNPIPGVENPTAL